MKQSQDHLLVTHVGSLPRSDGLLEMLVAANEGRLADREEFRERVLADTEGMIRNQVGSGVDIGSDGELPRLGFQLYVKDRMTAGFGGATRRDILSDFHDFPGYAELKLGSSYAGNEEGLIDAATLYEMPAAVDRVEYDPDLTAVKEELGLFSQALEHTGPDAQLTETFVTAATPGIVSTTMLRADDNPAYATDRDYVLDLAQNLKREYEYIVSQGHVLQLDAPDLAMERQGLFRGRPLSEFLVRVETHVEAINLAIADLPKDRVRLHVCWGNWDGPHVNDVELSEVIRLIYKAEVGALSIPTANPRHEHEWKVFRDNPLPDDKILLGGVIDVTTNYVEHPELVADRLTRLAEAVGPQRLIASTDCGFGSYAGFKMVADDVVWAKLRALSDGAAIASERLF